MYTFFSLLQTTSSLSYKLLLLLFCLGVDAANAQTSQVLFQRNGVLETGDAVLTSDQTLFDPHTFFGQAGQHITVTLTSSDFDTYLIVLDPSSSNVAENDDRSPSDRSSEVSLVLSQTGTYTLVANGYGRSDRGAYQLTVTSTSNSSNNITNTTTTQQSNNTGNANTNNIDVSQSIGWQMLGSNNPLNYLSIPLYNYFGECPGRALGESNVVFRSNTLEPMDGLDVEVRNISSGMDSSPFPHIDRDYEDGASSEPGLITLRDRHVSVFIGRKKIAVAQGINNFEYEIKDGSSVVERGSFTSVVVVPTIDVQRDRQRYTEEYCKTGQPMRLCEDNDVREREVWRCPGEATSASADSLLDGLIEGLFD
jgi:hypothetical protein